MHVTGVQQLVGSVGGGLCGRSASIGSWCDDFAGQNEGTLSMVEGELLSVVEEDKGDGWTRVRRNLEEEGYVPTSYIKVFLDSGAKGACSHTHGL